MTPIRSLVTGALAALALAGCSSGGTKSDAGPPNTNCGGATKACLTGIVSTAASADAANPSAVGGATISLPDGTFLGTTNTQGWYFVRNVPAGQDVSVCFEAAGYARRCRNITASGGQNVQVSTTGLLTRGAFTGAIDPAVGGTIALGTATSISFPPGSACREGVGSISGTVSCALTPILGANELQRGTAPGDFRGRQTAGAVSQLETGGMMEIVCRDGSGGRVNVCAGRTVTIRFPVDGATCANAALHPDTMQSWGYDEVAGLWREYGTFVKTCGGTSANSYYQGAVNHFSYWNADRPLQTTCATGRVLDGSGTPVVGALVKCDGDATASDGYQGPSEAYTDEAGAFCVPVKTSSSFKCIARKGAFVSAAKAGLRSGATPLTCGSPSCTAIGDFSVTDPITRIVLTWGADPRDLDSHVVGADHATTGGVHVYYGSRGNLAAAPFIELDTDDTSGFGPEIVSFVHGAKAQKYRYCVHHFSGTGNISTSGAIVDAFLGGSHIRVEAPPGVGTNVLWRVLEFTLDAAGNPSGVRVLNDFQASSSPATCMQ